MWSTEPVFIKNAKPSGVKVQLLSWVPDEAVSRGGGGTSTDRKHGQRVNKRWRKEKGWEAWENVRVSVRGGGAWGGGQGQGCACNLLTRFSVRAFEVSFRRLLDELRNVWSAVC